MPVLASFLGLMFSSALKLFARFFVLEKAAKLAFWTVTLSLIVGLFAAMVSGINSVAGVISGVTTVHPAIAMGFGIAFNNATVSAVGAYMSVWIICQLYVIKKQAINMIAGS